MYDFLIKNARLSSKDFAIADIAVSEGRICGVGKFSENAAKEVFDADSNFVMPAFLDIHFHGAAGADFCDASSEGLEKICKAKLAEGAGAIVPATLSLPENDIANALENARAFTEAGENLCRIFGAHIEGPFINPQMTGAQNPEYLKLPNIDFVKRLSEKFKLLKLSYAPELGAEFSAQLLSLDIVPSCVHSAATYAQFMDAYACGLRNISHFANRLTPISSRDIGAMGAGLMLDDVFTEIIADGFHLSDDMLRLVLAKKPHSKIVLITDSMRASGMPEGASELGGLKVFVSDGQARLANGALAGSVLKMNEAVKKIMDIGGLALEDAAAMASLNPAQSLGISDYGKIEEGYLADFAVLDKNCNVLQTIVGGKIVYSK